MTTIEDFLLLCLAQDGDRYVFGHEVRMDDPNPDRFDCSELVQWAARRAGVIPIVPDGSWYQVQHCRRHNTLLTVEEGIGTRGALLFRFAGDPWGRERPRSAHVAISLGDGTTIEARGSRWGVGSWSTENRGWTHAGRIPGVDYTPTPRIGPFVKDIHDPDGTPDRPGREPFWSVYASGHVFTHNGARPLVSDMSTSNLVAPISGAWYKDGVLFLSATGDGGTFGLEPQ